MISFPLDGPIDFLVFTFRVGPVRKDRHVWTVTVLKIAKVLWRKLWPAMSEDISHQQSYNRGRWGLEGNEDGGIVKVVWFLMDVTWTLWWKNHRFQKIECNWDAIRFLFLLFCILQMDEKKPTRCMDVHLKERTWHVGFEWFWYIHHMSKQRTHESLFVASPVDV